MTTMTSETLLESYSLLTCHCQCQTSFCDEKFQNLDIYKQVYEDKDFGRLLLLCCRGANSRPRPCKEFHLHGPEHDRTHTEC